MSDESRDIIWLPDGCPDWCADGDLHADYEDYVDRSHFGALAIVPLLADEDRPLHTENPELQVHLRQHYREVEPRVHVGKNGEPGVFLTLAEAERLAQELRKITATGRGDEPEGEPDDVVDAFYAGHVAGLQDGRRGDEYRVSEHWKSYAAWKAGQ